MSLRWHTSNPEEAVETAFFRIQQNSMTDVPILNPALTVQAIDFQPWQGHWLGIVITPWCMSLMLVPGSADNWASVGVNKRRFVKFPAGDFAFLGGDEDELGEYQSCSLFSPMNTFESQFEAVQTARAALIGLFSAPAVKDSNTEEQVEKRQATRELSRRSFLAFRKS